MTLSFYGIFLIFCFVWISASYAADSEGSFEISTVNDPPYIVDWYHNTTLIEPGTDILFHATVWDIDNSSDELTVTLWYSNDTFMYDNNSVSMVFYRETAADKYRYNYTIDGPNGGIYAYYYEATDGEFIDYKPAGYDVGVYFYLQWITLIETVPTTVTEPWNPSGWADSIGNWFLQIGFALFALSVFGALLVLLFKRLKARLLA